jgi:glyoxylate/hydroxypyruvate reductase A
VTPSRRRLAVVHHRHAEWVSAISGAEPRLDVRGWHPRDFESGISLDDGTWLAGAEGLFVWKVPPGLVARMPRLAWVQNSGAGVDHLLADPSLPASIPVTRADGRFGLWMARYVAAHLLAEAERLDDCRSAQAEGRWAPGLLPEDLTGKKALVFGFGRIGRQIGRALRELGMEVHGFVRTPREDPEFALHGPGELGALLPSARLLVLSAPLTEGTAGLVDARLLANGNASLTLVNVARGGLVDGPALLDALDGGRLGRAVLDVFPVEPLEAGSPLWGHPKVVVTPHHSGPSTPRAMVPDILPNLRRFAEGLPVEDAVDRERGY